MIDIWDTAGQEAYDNIHPTYYFEANSALLVFDTTRKITYKNCMKWYNEFRTHCPSTPCILVGNKIDIDKMGVYFKNNCPLAYPTYDDFRLYYLNDNGNEYVIEMMSEYTKQRFKANYVVFHKSNWSKPVFMCRTSRELVNWLNDCSSCEI